MTNNGAPMDFGIGHQTIDLTGFGFEPEAHVKKEKTEEMDEELELEVEVKGVVKNEVNTQVEDKSSSSCQVSSSASLDDDSDVDDNKRCGVCNRIARCNHFGAVCCDSCKAFFRRSVQSKVFDTFYCVKEGKCDVSQNRKSCQACRFKRCEYIGMDISLVMNEHERKALMTRKLERRRKMAIEHKRHGSQSYRNRSDHLSHISNAHGNQCQPCISPPHMNHDADVHHSLEFLSAEDQVKISGLRKLLLQTLSFPEFPQHYYEKNADVLEHLFFIFCKGMGKFFGSTPELRELQINDQRILLKPAVARAAFIFGTHQYDTERQWWPRRPFTNACTFPRITLTSVGKFVDDDATVRKWKVFFQKYYYLYSDEIFMILSLMVALFDHVDPYLVGTLEIASRKRKYLHLLERYMQQYQARISVPNAMSHFMDSLVDLQGLGECFQRSNAEENLGSATSQEKSLQFSSSLGDGMNLPLKKALNKRTASFTKEMEDDEVIVLDDDDDDEDLNSPSELKPDIQNRILNCPVKQEYEFHEVKKKPGSPGLSATSSNLKDMTYESAFTWPDPASASLKILSPQLNSEHKSAQITAPGYLQQKPSLITKESQSTTHNTSDQVTLQPLLKETLAGDFTSQKSSEEEVLKVLYKSLPPHLAELWAKKIFMSTKGFIKYD